MKRFSMAFGAALIALASPAFADFQQVTSRDAFVQLLSGKKLTRPFVELQVTPDGRINGRGAAWDVTGQWQWKGNYLCRSLKWGGDDLGYNCQEVKVQGNTVRITSDQGAGQSADFRLR